MGYQKEHLIAQAMLHYWLDKLPLLGRCHYQLSNVACEQWHQAATMKIGEACSDSNPILAKVVLAKGVFRDGLGD